MNLFLKELEVGEIHQRDNWQFELKSEFFPLSKLKKNTYKQEFYFFLPNALQVNDETYSREQFYRDQTNLIRYKTPEFTLHELLDKHNERSPFTRIHQLSDKAEIEDELKLLGNIVRSSLREHVHTLIDLMKQSKLNLDNAHSLCDQIKGLRHAYSNLEEQLLESARGTTLESQLYYIDDFISNSINFYLTGLLQEFRKKMPTNHEEMEREIRSILLAEKKHRQERKQDEKIEGEKADKEHILYQKGLLNKFVLNALLLNTTRSMVYKQYRNLIGAISAGIAMLFFFVLFVWQGNVFIINSLPFIIITIFLYILKDRIKEGIRTLSYKRFHKWFPDYSTDIRSPDNLTNLGTIKESFSFVRERETPREITTIRNREFHEVLETFKRPERVIYYKKEVTMFQTPEGGDIRRHALNIIFRFNIDQFLKKMDNPTTLYTTVDTETGDLIQTRLPKVYHLNIILKNTFLNEELKEEVELKKFRLILDKNGIKRLELVK